MFDGMVRTLKDVRHVADLKTSLISLGRLDSNGFTFNAKGGALRVVKGAMIVLKGKMQRTLYSLVGSTMLDHRQWDPTSQAAGMEKITRKEPVMQAWLW